MKTTTLQEISAILTCNGISHENTKTSILVNRDSICQKISGKSEQDSQDQLIEILTDAFNIRFNYVTKTDEWLMLDSIG